ncbi:MAG: ElyC/SanA/YdcF family protein [bacterium]|nr:ElyC/SanA/YdcF family protein [bacterium]
MADLKNAVAPLSEWLVRNSGGKWAIAPYGSTDFDGAMLGGSIRLAAVKLLHGRENFDTFIAIGGKGKHGDYEYPDISAFVRREFVRMGIARSSIIRISGPASTYAELHALKKFLMTKESTRLTVVSNEHHLGRIKAMMEYDPELRFLGREGRMIVRAAERIALEYAFSDWIEVITKARESEAIEKRRALEEHGILDLKAGRYRFR